MLLVLIFILILFVSLSEFKAMWSRSMVREQIDFINVVVVFETYHTPLKPITSFEKDKRTRPIRILWVTECNLVELRFEFQIALRFYHTPDILTVYAVESLVEIDDLISASCSKIT